MIKAAYIPRWLLYFGLTFLSWSISGQVKFFDHYGLRDGLNASQVLSMVKDSIGYLWIGTENGLFRYDGHVFKPFYSDYFDNNTISRNFVSNLEIDKHNRLWIGSILSVDLMDPVSFQVRRLTTAKQTEPRQITQFVYESEKDRMWIMAKNGIFYNDGKEISIKEHVIDELGSTHSNKLVIDSKGLLWIIQNSNVYRHDRYSCELKKFVLPDHVKINDLGDALLCGYNQGDSVLWIGSWIHGLIALDMQTETFKSYRMHPGKRQELAIRSISPDPWSDHLLWLATSEGVITFDTGTGTFKSYYSEYVYDAHGIGGEGFSFLYAPPEGLWIGTWKGLYRFDPNKNFLIDKEIPISEPHEAIIPSNIIFENNSGSSDSIVWLSTPYGTFFRYDLVHESILDIPSFLTKYQDWEMVLRDMHLDTKQRLWMSSHKYSLLVADLNKNHLLKTNIEEHKNTRFYHIRSGENERIWIGSDLGLYYSDNSEEIIIKKDGFLTDFLADNGYYLFIGRLNVSRDGKELLMHVVHRETYERRALFYLPDEKKISILTPEEYPVLQQIKDFESIHKISENKYLATTFVEGLVLIEKSGDTYHIDRRNQFRKKKITSSAKAAVDKEGNALITTDFGVLYYDINTDDIIPVFSINSNFQDRIAKGIYGVAFSEKSKNFYIGGNNGLTVFNPEQLSKVANKNIYLSEIKINDQEVNKDLFVDNSIKLKHNQNHLDFFFTNLQFTNSDLHNYHYVLKESNDVIYEFIGDQHINFANIAPGQYSLQVTSSDYFSNISEEPLFLFFRIYPPFWQTTWFYAILLACITTVIYSFFKYKDNQRLKLQLLRNKIAKDLHDDMGGTLSYIKILSAFEAKKNKNSAYQKINVKTDEVISNMAEIIWSINPKNDAFDIIISRIREFAVENLEPLDIDISFETDEIPEKLKLDPETRRNFYLIMKETIHNIAKHSKATKVRIRTEIHSKSMLTSIKDNGIGFDPEQATNGNGMRNIRDRASAMGAKLTIKASPGNGTEMILEMRTFKWKV